MNKNRRKEIDDVKDQIEEIKSSIKPYVNDNTETENHCE